MQLFVWSHTERVWTELVNVMVEMATRWHTCIIQRYHYLICIASWVKLKMNHSKEKTSLKNKVGQTDQNYKNTFCWNANSIIEQFNTFKHHTGTRYLFFVMFITSFEHSNKLFWIITPEDARSLHKNSIKSMTLNFTALPFYHSTARIRFSSLCRTGGGEGQKLWDKQHPRNGSSTEAITGSFVQNINK